MEQTMGIPYYVASLIRNHKHIQKNLGGGKVKTDILAIDFNCFIHHYLKAENPIGSVVVALHELLTDVVEAKQVYVAFDGLVPYAKMVQQRYRRMRRGETGAFDKHQISPGTPYMKELSRTLKFMFRDMIVSDTLEPGEGEHKIFTWLRTLPADQRKKVTIYGLDADLVVIALAQNHLADIQLLRETDERGFSTISITELEKVLPVEKEIFIKMSIMCFGNDFMPNLGLFSLRENGYTRAIYYSNRNDADKDELKILMKMAKPENRHVLAPDGYALEKRMSVHLMDGVLDWEPVCYAFWKTYAWVYHYFTTSEVLDWEWYYPYPEAPLLTTLEDFERPTTFVWEHPTPTMSVEDQLHFILPARSLTVPPKFADELYDEETECRHPWLRKFAWECDPYVSLPHGPLTSATEVHLL
jgi:5'-3' exonuclease